MFSFTAVEPWPPGQCFNILPCHKYAAASCLWQSCRYAVDAWLGSQPIAPSTTCIGFSIAGLIAEVAAKDWLRRQSMSNWTSLVRMEKAAAASGWKGKRLNGKRNKSCQLWEEGRWHDITEGNEKIRCDIRWDDMRWHWIRWDELTMAEMRRDEMRCDEIRWPETRVNPWKKMAKIQHSKDMAPEWQVKRLLLWSTEGFAVTYRHTLCSAL